MILIKIPGGTGLHRAAKNGQFETVKFLVSKGADINLEDDVYSFKPWELGETK